MNCKEQILIFLYKKIQELNKRIKEDEEEISKRELELQLNLMEDLLRDYFNLSD